MIGTAISDVYYDACDGTLNGLLAVCSAELGTDGWVTA